MSAIPALSLPPLYLRGVFAALELSEKLRHFSHDSVTTMVAILACVVLFAYWILRA